MDTVLADPARDVRDEIAAQAGVIELPDKIWFHKTAAATIDAGRCVSCAGCIAACPSGSIDIDDDGRPTLVRMCTGCSSCWDFCPLAGLRTERLARLAQNGHRPLDGELGTVRAAYCARAKEAAGGAQDGGAVTALLHELLRLGRIDGAIVSRRKNAFAGESVLARSGEELRQAAGSVYDQSFPLALLARPLPAGVESVAMVGTPCQVSVLRGLQRFPWPYRRAPLDAVTLTISLFCTRSFHPARLRRMLVKRGVDAKRTERLDVRDGKLTVVLEDGERVAAGSVDEVAAAGLRGCDECADFGGRLADVSVGNCGSPRGYTTVIVRTDAGEEAWRTAAGVLDWYPLDDLGPVLRLERRNRRRALRHLRREYSPEGSLWISYSEHLRAYAGSDRAPTAPPPHRSHHYRVSC